MRRDPPIAVMAGLSMNFGGHEHLFWVESVASRAPKRPVRRPRRPWRLSPRGSGFRSGDARQQPGGVSGGQCPPGLAFRLFGPVHGGDVTDDEGGGGPPWVKIHWMSG